MAARLHDTTRAEMDWNGAAERSHGKAKNGAYGRSCGIAQIGTDYQGDGEAAMGRESKRIEKLLNGKAKPRVEPSSHGIDQRSSGKDGRREETIRDASTWQRQESVALNRYGAALICFETAETRGELKSPDPTRKRSASIGGASRAITRHRAPTHKGGMIVDKPGSVQSVHDARSEKAAEVYGGHRQ